MEFLNGCARLTALLCVTWFNVGIVVGLTLGMFLLLRPVLKRLLSPQQRVVLWGFGWVPAYVSSWYELTNFLHFLPLTFRDLVVPRMRYRGSNVPAFLPDYHDYHGPDTYNIALPGGGVFELEVTQVMVTAFVLVWFAGAVGTFILFHRGEKRVYRMAKAGVALPDDHPLMIDFPEVAERNAQIRICEHIPTSFVMSGHVKGERGIVYTICLQKELSPQRMRLVLRHELNHIRLKHCWLKQVVSAALLLNWWNPIFWVANRYFCQDLELACDQATLKSISREKHREYAQALVELAAGRQLWEAPVCFGECDAQLRVKEIVAWKPGGLWTAGWQWLLLVLLILFFTGGPYERILPEDLVDIWSADITMTQAIEGQILEYSHTQPAPIQEIWLRRTSNTEFWVKLSDSSWWKVLGHYNTRLVNGEAKLNFYLYFAEPMELKPALWKAVSMEPYLK